MVIARINGFFSFAVLFCSFLVMVSLASAEPLNVSLVDPTPFSPVSSSFATLNASVFNQTPLSGGARIYGGFNFNRSLLAWWTMDEQSGGAVVDKSGRGNVLTLFGNASLNTTFSKFGCCSLYLNNSVSDFTRNSGRGIVNEMLTNDGFSVSFWIYYRQFAPSDNYILMSNGANANGIRLFITNSTSSSIGGTVIGLTLGNGTGNVVANSRPLNITVGNWHHIGVVYYREIAYFYLEGQLHSTYAFPQVNVTNSSNAFINVGNNQAGVLSPAAFLDDFLIYSRPLMSDEIGSLYNVSHSGQDTRYFSSRLFGFPANNFTLNAFALDSSGSNTTSSNITINFTQSGPYFLAANASFEPIRNRTALSAWISPGFYNGSSPYPVSSINGSAYYRVNDGSWIYINQSQYLAKNTTLYGFYGDSFTGYGSSSMTWDHVLAGLSKVAMYNTDQKHGVPSTVLSQIRANIIANATNGSNIFLQGGTNDITAGSTDNAIITGYLNIFNSSRAKNLSIYLANIIPRNSTTQNVNVSNINTWLYSYYLTNNSDNLIAGFTDVYSAFIDNSTNRINESLSADGLHPNPSQGVEVWGLKVFENGFRHRYHDGFYAEFVPPTPEVNSTYDLKWIMTSPTGETSEYQWDNLFNISGSYPAPAPNTTSIPSPSSGPRSGFGSGIPPSNRSSSEDTGESESGSSGSGSNNPEESVQVEPQETGLLSRISNYLESLSTKTKGVVNLSYVYISIGTLLAVGIIIGIVRVHRSRAEHHSPQKFQLSDHSWWLWKK